MLLYTRTSRRKLIAGAATGAVALVAITLVGCEDEQQEDTRVTSAKKKAEEYLLRRLSEWSGELHPAIWTSIFALTLSRQASQIQFANGADVAGYMSQVTLTPNIAENLENLNRIVMIEIADGKTRTVDIRNRYLGTALERGLLDNRNDILAKALVLDGAISRYQKVDESVSTEVKVRLQQNRQELGWSFAQTSEIKEQTVPVTDLNALCVLSGVAEQRLLELSRSGRGWREYVLDTQGDANLYTTLWVSWARGQMSEQTLRFVLAHQASDGGFANNIGGETTEEATAEALAYFASRGHRVFGRSLGS